MALTYGPESDWVKNVLAAGGCSIETRGRTLTMTQPHLVHDESRRDMPAVVRTVLGLGDVTDFLALDYDGVSG